MPRPPHARRVLASLALALSLGLIGCRPPDGGGASVQEGERIRIEVEPRLGPSPLSVYLLDGDAGGGDGVAGARVTITATMTHAGMQPVLGDAEEVEPGLYRADDFAFTMAGDWIVTAEVTLPDGRALSDERTLAVPAER